MNAISDIDFVIPWVDGADPEWQKKALYTTGKPQIAGDTGDMRYRDWGILHYWFRAVEKFAPWVRKIHFITCGQVPEWLNLNHPKLHFVRHEDYIPHKWLPTFSSHTIELNIFRIQGLSEKFVYFNDDMFINAPVSPEDFFVNGLPCSCAALSAGAQRYDDCMPYILLNHIQVLWRHFDFKTQFKANISKWINFRYKARILAQTFMLLPFMRYTGFYECHTANSYLKSTFTEVWEKEKDILEATSSHRFRGKEDVNQWLMEYWQVMSGKFIPRHMRALAFYNVSSKNINPLISDLKRGRHKIICINDGTGTDNFDEASAKIQQAYSEILPDKSEYEL